jgi:hypothetical protein
MKRVFDFDGQSFCDNFDDEGLRLVVFVVPNASLDDYLRYGHGARTFAGEAPAAELEELLSRSSARRAGAAIPLLAYLHDERVRPSLVNLCRLVDLQGLADVAQALGNSGGPDAVGALLTRLHELMARREPFLKEPFFNVEAGALKTVAISLLKLAPEEPRAAECLLQLFEHPTHLNRLGAVRGTSELVVPQRRIRTIPYLRLRKELLKVSRCEDPELFVGCAPLLLDDPEHRSETIDRFRTVLTESPIAVREMVITALLFFSVGHDSLSTAHDHLRVEKSTRLRIQIAKHLGRLLGREERQVLVEEGLSSEAPSVRLDSLALLPLLPDRAQRITLAVEATESEPDLFLKQLLMSFSSRERASS